jgi:hypothetical protein
LPLAFSDRVVLKSEIGEAGKNDAAGAISRKRKNASASR